MRRSSSKFRQFSHKSDHHRQTSNIHHEQSSASGHCSPLYFDSFLPWVCMQWCVEELVTVVRVEDDQCSQSKIKQKRKSDLISEDKISSQKSAIKKTYAPSNTIQVRATYAKLDLVGISIEDCHVNIPVKVIRAICLCLPFHPTLTRLNIRKGGVTAFIVYEIGKLLPQSNVTNLCLDDSYVPEGNYDMLLQKDSQLTYLSLNRCKINDDVCERIAMNLVDGTPGTCVRALELASNNITDRGAHFLAIMLRSNRSLLHLNIADNDITDDGGTDLISSLGEFCLTSDETISMKRKRLKYFMRKQELYDTCMADLLQQNTEDITDKSIPNSGKTQTSSRSFNKKRQPIKSHKKNGSTASSPPLITTTQSQMAESLASGIVGEFVHPFSSTNVVNRNGYNYAKGNFVLCSLNVAYNNLYYPFLRLLQDTVEYQKATVQSPATGLMRIVIDGNKLPASCDEMDRLETLLKEKLCLKNELTNMSRRQSTIPKKIKPKY